MARTLGTFGFVSALVVGFIAHKIYPTAWADLLAQVTGKTGATDTCAPVRPDADPVKDLNARVNRILCEAARHQK